MRRRPYDPEHCTACGDFLPCGESWIETTEVEAALYYANREIERIRTERDEWERIAGERFAAANVLHAKWQDAESRIERVRVDLDFIIGAYVGPPIPHEAIAIVLDMVDARLRDAPGQL